MFEIVKIPKPDNLPSKRAGDSKYPYSTMQVGDSFVVPSSEMRQGEDSEKFRQRVYQSGREHARREFLSREGDDKGEKKEFTAAVMDKDDTSSAKAFFAGDVVVWRDK